MQCLGQNQRIPIGLIQLHGDVADNAVQQVTTPGAIACDQVEVEAYIVHSLHAAWEPEAYGSG